MKIILPDGTYVPLEMWQQMYNVKDKSIGKYFSIGEKSITFTMTVASRLIVLLDRYRELRRGPVTINSLYRTEEKQQELIKEGLRAAKVSPHCYGMAADIDTISRQDTVLAVDLLKKAAKELSLDIRIGYKTYMADGNTFVHVDVCPMFFAKGKPFYNIKHPLPWESVMIW